MPTMPEGFPLQYGTGIIAVDDNGIIIDAQYGAKGFVQADERFQFIIANVSNFDIMKCIGGTIELVKFKPTIKFSDGSNQTPPPPEPTKPPTTDERLKAVEETMLLMMGGMLL